MGIYLRLLLLGAFSWVGYFLYSETEIEAHLPTPDTSKMVLLFGGAVLDGLGFALVLTIMIVPALGQRAGAFFFNPGGEIEHDPHMGAIARLAQGDPEGAIADYEEILEKDPSDTLALSEIARICCRDLGDTARAAIVIERALEEEWPHDQSSFLANRLADIYLFQDDRLRARQILIEIASTMDGTKYAANALHRLHEIDRSIEAGVRAPAFQEALEESPAPEAAQPEEAQPASEESEPSARG
jgi:tetratricopeptide (TPR) repeat protein